VAWQDSMTLLLRQSINDIDDPTTYTDERLQLALVCGAFKVIGEFDFGNIYTVNLPGMTISPDPTVPVPPDYWFTNLTVMKTALDILSNNLRLAAAQAFSIKDIDVAVDLRAVAQYNQSILNDMKKYYEEASAQYRIGVYSAGQAIISPFNILAGGLRSPTYGMSDRNRMIW
jgi:hypothetical protein